MTSLDSGRYAVSIGAAAALLGGCAQSQPAIGLPGAIPQGVAAARTHTIAHRILPGSSYQVLFRFGPEAPPHVRSHGAHPAAAVIDVKGTLYGTTYDGGSSRNGTAYRLSAAGKETVLHTFHGGSDGAHPWAGLTDVNGTLYGTTYDGGSSDYGTVYSISTTGVEKVLHSFSGGSFDGAYPVAGLIDVNGTLYGTTRGGGGTEQCSVFSIIGCGTVYSISRTGSEKVLHAFTSRPDGADPVAGLLDVKGTLYGTTRTGGANQCDTAYGSAPCGTVYSVSTTGVEKVLYSFRGGTSAADGAFPWAGLLDVDGVLYGTTYNGGNHHCGSFYGGGCGTVYSISTTGSEKVLHEFGFGPSDGALPRAALVDVKGTLYGTTLEGGSSGPGTVYSVSTTGKEQLVYSFGKSPDGASPEAGLTDVNGTLYGTTADGGASKCHTDFGGRGCGIVFKLTP